MGSASSGLTLSKSSSRSSGLDNLTESDLQVNIEELSNEDSNDILTSVMRLRVPFFDNPTIQTLANVTYLTGNGPFHEGLIFETRNGIYYIAQTYPVTFIMVNSLNDAVKEIVSFCQFNPLSHQYKITNSYYPTSLVTISDVAAVVKTMPNQYHILDENCQKFCQKIINSLKLRAVWLYFLSENDNFLFFKLKFFIIY